MARSAQLADLFRQPPLASQRHYEVCKAYFLDEVPAEQLATRFCLNADSVRAIVRDFAANPNLEQFFVVRHRGRQSAPKRDQLAAQIAELRGGLTHRLISPPKDQMQRSSRDFAQWQKNVNRLHGCAIRQCLHVSCVRRFDTLALTIKLKGVALCMQRVSNECHAAIWSGMSLPPHSPVTG